MKLLLKNGIVYDGTNSLPKRVDIYIQENCIQEIGTNLFKNDVREIDCTNLVIAPGFIDAHSHNDFFVKNENVEACILPFLKQGITTQIVGNCGTSAYGVNPNSSYIDELGSGMFKINHPSSLNQFKKDLEGQLMLNLVPLIGHGTIRTSLIGHSARPLSKDEMKELIDLTEQALKEGCYGGSFGLMYEPGMYAPKEELIEFAKVIKKHDGILTIHTRANSKVALGYSLIGKPHIEQALDEVIDFIKETGVRIEYSHLIYVGQASWKCADHMLRKFHDARKAGYDLAYDLYPFTYGASVITVILPSWYLKLPREERNKPVNRFKLKVIINVTKKLLGIDYSDLVISYISDEHKEYEGKTVAEIAKIENSSPFDTYLKLVDLSNGKGRIMLGKYYNEEIILNMMKDELSVFMTDAWYEDAGTQNAGTYQAFPFFLQKTRENHLELQNTIHKMTGLTAQRFKLKNRGLIKEGYFADITIFNYNEITINEKIPNETPQGIKYVIVNGEIVIENNAYTGIKIGKVL